MIFLSQWRMSLLFLISGASIYFSLGRRSTGTFVQDRLKRVLLPLVAGMLLVVPPQVYVERLTQGHTFSYAEFYPSIFEFSPYPEGNFSWHHLWYLAYIFCYSLLLLPVLLWLRRRMATVGRVSGWGLLLLPGLWLGIGELLLRPHWDATNALIDDWANHFLYVTVLLLGFVLFSNRPLLDVVQQARIKSLLLGLTLTACLYAFYWLDWQEPEPLGLAFYRLLKSLNRWAWLLAIVGLGLQHLTKGGPGLQKANEMVYPFYILHQTVIVVLGFGLRHLDWPVALKFGLMLLLTFLTCYCLIAFVIKRVTVLRVLFGMKAERGKEKRKAEKPVKKMVVPSK
jgi:glucans biosynthesis protein C